MLRRTSTLLVCLGTLALLTTGSHAQSDTDANEFTVDLATIDNNNDLLGLDVGGSLDVGPSSGPFSNKPGWPQDNPGQSNNSPPAPAPTTTTPAPTPTTPAPTGTAAVVAAVTPAPTPSMVPAPSTNPNSYVASTLAPTTNKDTPAPTTGKPTPVPTAQLGTSSSKCPKDSTLVSVEDKGSYCVSTLKPICSGASDKGNCPGKQSGLEQGSHCGLVKSGIFGCLPGAGPKRCDVDEDEDNY
ncbi:hypothetical protein Gpo141_00000423 [Globisporangium polare]